MNRKRGLLLISILTVSIIVGVSLSVASPSVLGFADSSTEVWHHYDQKLPTDSEKGIKEYWVKCGGGYQFSAPTTGTIIDKGINYNISEFAPSDDRWLTYCDVFGHEYDAHNVCTECLKHKGATKIADFAVSGSNKSEFNCPEGFNNVYEVKGKSNGYNGVNLNISKYNFIYFALYGSDSIRVFSGGDDGDGAHTIVWSGRWYYLLVEKIDGGWKGFIKEGKNGAWYSRTVDGSKDEDFSSLLRLYNWSSLPNVTIYSTEVYAGTELPVVSNDNINIGVWNGSYHFTSTSAINDIVDAGFNKVIGVNPVWNSNWNNILNYSSQKGVKFIVDPRKWDYENSCYLDWDGTVPSYANHDAVEGFIMHDEPSSKQFSSLATLKENFEAVMPAEKLFFVNMLSGAAGMSMLYGTENAQSNYNYYETNYVNAYNNAVNPDVYSFDSYPLFTNCQIRKSYFCTFDAWSNLSRNTNVPIWYTLLSSAHSSGDGEGYRYVLPSKEQLQWQMSVAISFGIKNLMHYVYATGDSDYSCMATINGEKTEYFNTVSSANHNIHSFEKYLQNLTWEGATTYHNNSKVNLLFKDLKHTLSNSSVGINSISATSDLLIGSYLDGINNRTYMVTNSGISTDYNSIFDSKYTNYNKNVAYSNNANSVSIKVSSNITGAKIIKNGVKSYVYANNNTISFDLDSYGSALVILAK